MDLPLVNSSTLTEVKLKKSFRSELLELCKTRTEKSSPDMFNFYVILAGHDMVTDAGRNTTCRRKKAPRLQRKYKKWRTFRKHGFNRENSLKISDGKKNRNKNLDLSKNPSGTPVLYNYQLNISFVISKI